MKTFRMGDLCVLNLNNCCIAEKYFDPKVGFAFSVIIVLTF